MSLFMSFIKGIKRSLIPLMFNLTGPDIQRKKSHILFGNLKKNIFITCFHGDSEGYRSPSEPLLFISSIESIKKIPNYEITNNYHSSKKHVFISLLFYLY